MEKIESKLPMRVQIIHKQYAALFSQSGRYLKVSHYSRDPKAQDK